MAEHQRPRFRGESRPRLSVLLEYQGIDPEGSPRLVVFLDR